MLQELYFHYMDEPQDLPEKMRRLMDEGEEKSRAVCDYISGMTDQYAIDKFHEYFVPVAWQVDGY